MISKPVKKTVLFPVVFLIVFFLSKAGMVSNQPRITGGSGTSGMVLVPAGEFIMGVVRDLPDDGKARHIDDHPHKVRISAFYMDKHEVTNRQYQEFCKATGTSLPFYWGMDQFRCGPKYPNHPVAGVPHYNAVKYAKWAGKRLPTEAEWEYAARGGLAGMSFPRGMKQTREDANFGRNYPGTLPVGSFKPNGYGLYDMSGNVVEWVADYYQKNYYLNSPVQDPKGPHSGRFKVIRGGGWFSGPYCANIYNRNGLKSNWEDFNVGFRCVKDIKQ